MIERAEGEEFRKSKGVGEGVLRWLRGSDCFDG